jgi:hypothetical protein
MPTLTPTPTATSTTTPTPAYTPTVAITPLATITPVPTTISLAPIVSTQQPAESSGVKAVPTIVTTLSITACNDGIDNDGDGMTDYLVDPGCESSDDATECGANRPECDNCIDDNKDGLIDVADVACLNGSDPEEGDGGSSFSECTERVIDEEKADLLLSLNRIIELAEETFTFLKRSPRLTTDKVLKDKLRVSTKRLRVKINNLSEQASIALKQLPDIILQCPDTVTTCQVIDNTDKIVKYVEIVSLLANYSLKSLNRGTRLLYTLTEARKITRPFGNQVRRARAELIGKAKTIPPVQSQCY